MKRSDIITAVHARMGDEYYEQLNALESDVRFFLLYLERNKNSSFRFGLRISKDGSNKAFDDIWRVYRFCIENIQIVFSEFMLLKWIIEDIHSEKNTYTEEGITAFITYFEEHDLVINDYVSDFVNEGREALAVKETFNRLRRKI